MLKIKMRLSKSNLATTSSITGQHGRTERRSVSRQTSTSTTKKTGASKKLSNSTHQDSNIQVESGSGIFQIPVLKEMAYQDIGPFRIKNIGSSNAVVVAKSNILAGQSLWMSVEDYLFVKSVMENSQKKKDELVAGSRSIKTENTPAIGFLS